MRRCSLCQCVLQYHSVHCRTAAGGAQCMSCSRKPHFSPSLQAHPCPWCLARSGLVLIIAVAHGLHTGPTPPNSEGAPGVVPLLVGLLAVIPVKSEREPDLLPCSCGSRNCHPLPPTPAHCHPLHGGGKGGADCSQEGSNPIAKNCGEIEGN